MIDLNQSTDLQELFARGAHYGYSRRRRHPSVNPYLYGFKNRIAIIDLEKSLEALNLAEDLFRKLGRAGRLGLLVGTKPEARLAIEAAGQKLSCPYLVTRWVGGTLTNFSEIKKRLARLDDLRKQLTAADGLSVYTKQERGRFQKEFDRLERSFATLARLTDLPGALFVVDPEAEKIAVAEARLLNLPVVALAGTDCDIRRIDYPIVVNDGSLKTIEWVVSRLVRAYEAGVVERAAAAVNNDQPQTN